MSHVSPGSPAEKAGVKRGDVIVSFDGKEINEMKDLPYIVGSTPVDKKVRMVVIRNGKKKHFKINITKNSHSHHCSSRLLLRPSRIFL